VPAGLVGSAGAGAAGDGAGLFGVPVGDGAGVLGVVGAGLVGAGVVGAGLVGGGVVGAGVVGAGVVGVGSGADGCVPGAGAEGGAVGEPVPSGPDGGAVPGGTVVGGAVVGGAVLGGAVVGGAVGGGTVPGGTVVGGAVPGGAVDGGPDGGAVGGPDGGPTGGTAGTTAPGGVSPAGVRPVPGDGAGSAGRGVSAGPAATRTAPAYPSSHRAVTSTSSPACGACTIVPSPRYIATWCTVPRSAGSYAQNSRSPGSRSASSTGVPTSACWRDTRGIATPAAAYERWVRPEQS
jgi:hypothetical protein